MKVCFAAKPAARQATVEAFRGVAIAAFLKCAPLSSYMIVVVIVEGLCEGLFCS